jgi:hypothetical protein
MEPHLVVVALEVLLCLPLPLLLVLLTQAVVVGVVGIVMVRLEVQAWSSSKFQTPTQRRSHPV